MESGERGARLMAPANSLFPTTLWTVVLEAREQATPALEVLCRRYTAPIRTYLRALGHSVHDAEDLTQRFLVHLIKPQTLRNIEQGRSPFRAFLLTALKHFLYDAHDYTAAEKRGGRHAHVPLEGQRFESLVDGSGGGSPPDRVFERTFARTLVSQAVERLEAEAALAGKEEMVASLLSILHRDGDREPYSILSARLGISAGALRTARTRIAERLRRLILEELAQVVPEGGDVEAELRQLLRALSS